MWNCIWTLPPQDLLMRVRIIPHVLPLLFAYDATAEPAEGTVDGSSGSSPEKRGPKFLGLGIVRSNMQVRSGGLFRPLCLPLMGSIGMLCRFTGFPLGPCVAKGIDSAAVCGPNCSAVPCRMAELGGASPMNVLLALFANVHHDDPPNLDPLNL